MLAVVSALQGAPSGAALAAPETRSCRQDVVDIDEMCSPVWVGQTTDKTRPWTACNSTLQMNLHSAVICLSGFFKQAL